MPRDEQVATCCEGCAHALLARNVDARHACKQVRPQACKRLPSSDKAARAAPLTELTACVTALQVLCRVCTAWGAT